MRADRFYVGFGKLVRKRRQAMLMTQAQLAKRLVMSRTSITNIERGRQRINLHQLLQIAAVLRVSHECLLPALPHDFWRSGRWARAR